MVKRVKSNLTYMLCLHKSPDFHATRVPVNRCLIVDFAKINKINPVDLKKKRQKMDEGPVIAALLKLNFHNISEGNGFKLYS